MLGFRFNSSSIAGERTVNTLFRDVMMGALGAIMLALIILLFHINPPKSEEADNQRARGNIRVEIIWPDELDVDIDLWSKAPGDVPVGYSNLNGFVFNLVRDDLGTLADLTGMNYEVSFTRGIPAGEYIINVVWFSNRSKATEIPVKVLITMKKNDGEHSKESPIRILTKTVILKRVTEELTVIRFTMNDDMDIVPGSLSTVQKKISRGIPQVQ